MTKTKDERKNLIAERLLALRRARHLSQRTLAKELQARGYSMDKNVITRIETNKRCVTDIELYALAQVFEVSVGELLEGE